MKHQDPLRAVRALLDQTRLGLLCTTSPDGFPRCRWMTAVTLPRVQDCIYCVSTADSNKVQDIAASNRVQWSFQTPNLDEIIAVCGKAEILQNPALKGEVLESLGPNLTNFWRVNPEPAKLVVIETVISKAQLFRPMEGLRQDQETCL